MSIPVFAVEYNVSEFEGCDSVEKHFSLGICVRTGALTFKLHDQLIWYEYMPKSLFEDFAAGKNVTFLKPEYQGQDFQDVSIVCKDGIVVIQKFQDFCGGIVECEIHHSYLKEAITQAFQQLIDAKFFE